ncbi:cell death specification protein 2 [Chrysoperla carnea]|uniref:cell death specification protein 2 n=1 Tax=Chrysoperla carnea TaxID=189513 RepID=UPI001D083EA5|nr:cell death specification protein 2 [Chrysoperla carnea]
MSLHYAYSASNRENIPNGPISPSFSSAIHFLRTYNSLLIPSTTVRSTKPAKKRNLNERLLQIENSTRISSTTNLSSPSAPDSTNDATPNTNLSTQSNNNYANYGITPSPFITAQNFIGYPPISKIYHQMENKKSSILPRSLSVSSLNFGNQLSRRQRGEKKPIPDEQKDDKYFERRKRNNQAAKKSRDARKIREDQIALRASMLEHENAILRAQILTLREEATSLRQMLFFKKSTESSQLTPDIQICSPT